MTRWDYHAVTARVLVEASADINAANDLGNTALDHEASSANHPSVVSELLELRAEVDARDTGGCTPLSSASIAGAVDAVRLLLDRGAHLESVNSKQKDVSGKQQRATALWFAARCGHSVTARVLSGLGRTTLKRATARGGVRCGWSRTAVIPTLCVCCWRPTVRRSTRRIPRETRRSG
jgi:ankyrin repeat protein